MAEFASNAKGNAALTTGIIGTAGAGLGLLGTLANALTAQNGAGGSVGRGSVCPNGNLSATEIASLAAAVAAVGGAGANGCSRGCNEDHTVTRYDAAQAAKIAELETEIKLRDANTYTDGKLLEVYKYVDGRLRDVEGQLCEQRVYNATNTAAIGCIQGQVAQLQSLTKLVVPNGSVCPGWGEVTVAPKAAASA